MTNHYDEMKVLPDPAQAEELRQRLHARMAGFSPHDVRADLHLAPGRHDADELVPLIDITGSDDPTAADRPRRGRRARVAAAIVVVVGAGGIAVSEWTSDNEDRPPAVTAAPPATAVPASPRGAQIRVTPDFILFGDGLVGVSADKEDGHLYVLAGHYPDAGRAVFNPEVAALAAFDDAGVEQWRTELDGVPSDVVVVDDDLWVSRRDGTVLRIDAVDGRVLGQLYIGNAFLLGAFGSLWAQTGDDEGHTQLIRVDPDLSTTTIRLPDRVLNGDDSPSGVGPEAGPDAIWVPLGGRGVAVVDPDTDKVTVIPAKAIGHAVADVAFDGDVAYVANDSRVSAIVDGEIVATSSPGQVGYLGPIDGVFGYIVGTGGQFQILRAKSPMVVGHRQITVEPTAGVREIDGEAWLETGSSYSLRRVHLLPVSPGDR